MSYSSILLSINVHICVIYVYRYAHIYACVIALCYLFRLVVPPTHESSEILCSDGNLAILKLNDSVVSNSMTRNNYIKCINDMINVIENIYQ